MVSASTPVRERIRRLEAKTITSGRKRKKKKLELIPGQENILKYLTKKSACSLKEPGGSEEGKSQGVRDDPLLGDTGQGSIQITSGSRTRPESEERGGRGGQRGGKRTGKVLERWLFLAGQTSSLREGGS